MVLIGLFCLALGVFIFGYLTYIGKIKDKPETILKMLSIKKDEMKYIDFDSIERAFGKMIMLNAGILGLFILGDFVEHRLLSNNNLFLYMIMVDVYYMGVLDKPMRFIKKEMLKKADDE